jgi:hypothetical protein
MAGRAWKDWEMGMVKEIMLKYRAEGQTMEKAAEYLATKLSGRTAAAIKWYWNNHISKMDGLVEEIQKADEIYAKNKDKNRQTQKKQWYQAKVAKVVTLPYKVVNEIESLKAKNDGSALYNLMELSTNPVLSQFLSDAKNTQLYFKALEVGYKPDKSGEELLIERFYLYRNQANAGSKVGHLKTAVMIETLQLLGLTNLIEKIKGENVNV